MLTGEIKGSWTLVTGVIYFIQSRETKVIQLVETGVSLWEGCAKEWE